MNYPCSLDKNKFNVKIIESRKDFHKIESHWERLLKKNSNCTPFQSHIWFKIWTSFFLNKKNLLILIIFEGESIVAIAPMMLSVEKYRKFFKIRKIKFLGNHLSPLQNIIIDENIIENLQKLLESIINFLFKNFNWDLIELNMIPEESMVFKKLITILDENDMKHRISNCAVNWQLQKAELSFTKYSEQLPKNLKRNLVRYYKKICKFGQINFKVILNSESLDYYLDLYDDLREKSWKAKEKDKEFSRIFLNQAAQNGWSRLFFMFVGQTPVAAAKYLVHGKTAIGLDSVYDLKWKKYSIGTIHTSEIFRYVIDVDKVSVIDLGRGDQYYKSQWANDKKVRKGITIFNDNLKGSFLEILEKTVLPYLKNNKYIERYRSLDK